MSLLRVLLCGVLLLTACAGALAAGNTEKPYQKFYREGVAANKAGKLDEAITLYSKALATKKDSADLYFVRGRAYKQRDRYDLAISDFSKAIELNPRYAEAYNHRGIIFVGKGDRKRATADFNSACALGQKDSCANLEKLKGMK